ncbi:MAG: hypothetical protein J6R29_04860 [Clostridia bacterium]|nr:hypothetical protein [Clostridia bacterium]
MALKIKKLFNTNKTKYFWLYIVLGALFTIVAVMLMPFWKDFNIDVFFAPWGYKIVKSVVAVALVLYLVFFLFKKLKTKSNGVVKILIILEFVILSLIAIACLFNQFVPFKVGTVGQILGFVLWVRGSIEVFRAYYYGGDGDNHSKYPVWQIFVAILLISVGTYFTVSNVLSDKAVLWTVTSIITLCGIIAIILGIVKQPAKKKIEKDEKLKETPNTINEPELNEAKPKEVNEEKVECSEEDVKN